MIGVAHDITELKAAQAQAEENEQNYRLLLNSTAEGIYGLDEHGLCTFCNTAAARMLGYADPEQALGRRMHSTHHHHRPDGTEYPVEDCKIYQAFRQGHGTHAEDEIFFRLNGESFPSEYWSYPIVRNNVIVGSVTTFLDITERRRAEARLRNSEAQYRTIFQSAPYGISRSTADGGILVVNPALVRMLGYETESDLTSITNMARIYAEPEQRSELIAGLHSFGSVNDKEVVWLCKDGRKITVRVNATIVDRRPDGVPEVVQAFVEDVTERKLLEKQFWQAQKMEAVGRLAGGIAHDFNNVLMISRSYAELILQTEGSDDKVRRYAREIEQSSARAASVTRQLLAFSRQQMLAPEYLKLNEVIAELGKILPKIVGEDVEVATLTAEVPCVLADRGQAEQVILNLAVNARDAMPKGGRLSITTRAVTINASSSSSMHPLSPGIYVCLSVADTGIGMDADTKSRIFEPFFTTKDRGKGTGLGLAAVYAIVKQSNGSIFVESEPGDGTTFHIYLPAIPAAATVKPSAPESLCQSGSETVLVVEDEAHLRDAIHEYLTSLGYNVLTAGNATETIQIAMQGASRIDAIITDMVLPGIDGSELADTVSSLHPEARILFMSGYIDRAVEGHGARFPLLRKPFCLSDLASRLRQSLDEDRIGGKETG